jgi:hypothetical protein
MVFNYAFTDFLPVRLVYFPYRGAEVSNYNSRFAYFSLLFYQFSLHTFWYSVIKHIHIKDCYVFLGKWCTHYFVISLFYSGINLLTLQFSLSETNIATSPFFWLMLVLCIFLQAFTLNWCASSYLPCICYGWCIANFYSLQQYLSFNWYI